MRRTTIAAALAVFGLSACAPAFQQSPGADGTAVYALDTVDDRPLPYTQMYGTSVSRHEIASGMLLLRRDGTFLMDLTYFVATPDRPSHLNRTYEGSWSRSGNTFLFAFDHGAETRGVLRDGVLDMEGQGVRYQWVR